MSRGLASLAICALALACGCTAAGHRSSHLATGPETRASARLAAVRLVCIDFTRLEAPQASAFFVSADGLLVTCAHVIEGSKPLSVELPDGTEAAVAHVVATDAEADLALLRIRG